MKLSSSSDQFAQKMRKPAGFVFIVFPLLCLALLAFRWSGFWLTNPWMVGVTIYYYALAMAYLFFTFIVRMRVIAVIGLILLLIASLFMWIPYNWVLAVLLVPALFIAFYRRGNTITAVILSTITCIIVVIVLVFSLFTRGTLPEKYAYHTSPDGQYVIIEHSFILILSGTDVLLCQANGPLLVSERVLYLADYSDFGGKIEWLDSSTVIIYGDSMDVFKDPVIKNYTPF